MFPENEIMAGGEFTTLVLGLVVLVFMCMNYSALKRIPSFKFLAIAYYLLLVSFVATVVEGFFWEVHINFLEHFCNALSAIFVAIWFWKVFIQTKEPE